MAKRNDEHAKDGVDGLMPAFGERERSRHHAQSQSADCCREHEAMLQISATKRESADNHRKCQADFMDDRSSEEAACRGEQAQEDSGADAMDDTKAGYAHGNPVEPAGRHRVLVHLAPHIEQARLSYNITSARRTTLALRLVAGE